MYLKRRMKKITVGYVCGMNFTVYLSALGHEAHKRESRKNNNYIPLLPPPPLVIDLTVLEEGDSPALMLVGGRPALITPRVTSVVRPMRASFRSHPTK
jgi:hypothetical protein